MRRPLGVRRPVAALDFQQASPPKMPVGSARLRTGETGGGRRSLVRNPKRRRVAALQRGLRLFGNNSPVVSSRSAVARKPRRNRVLAAAQSGPAPTVGGKPLANWVVRLATNATRAAPGRWGSSGAA